MAAFKVGQHVQEVAAPHRKGYVRAIRGSGPSSHITVALTGLHPVDFRPAQIVHV